MLWAVGINPTFSLKCVENPALEESHFQSRPNAVKASELWLAAESDVKPGEGLSLIDTCWTLLVCHSEAFLGLTRFQSGSL